MSATNDLDPIIVLQTRIDRLHAALAGLLEVLYNEANHDNLAVDTWTLIDLRRLMGRPPETGSYGDKPNGEWWE